MLICGNASDLYSAYQWYKSDTFTGPYTRLNATGQYYTDNGKGLDGYFYAEVTLKKDGSKVNSDTISIHTQPVTKVSVFPNPASKSSAINIETTSPDIQLAKIQIFTMQGIEFEIEGYITLFMQKYPDLSVFLTGRGSIPFVAKLKNPIFAELNLVLIGLNRILTYNAQL